ncbi:hypothetical protein [Hymenobacter sp. B1770]|uniref:hypothetical protein n=1 Tax=Hymenobacter sp. B1770 TaxID=1718788 RepID=UPI003CF3D3C1
MLLLIVLGSCSIFRPYRLPTPKPSPEFKAQQKAAVAARKKNEPPNFLNKRARAKEEAATDVSTPTGGAIKAPPTTPEARTLPERSTIRYDKNGLMKKPKLMRRRINKPAPKPFRPWKAIRHFFKFIKHGKPNYSPDHRPAPKQPVEPTAMPDPTPGATPAGKS